MPLKAMRYGHFYDYCEKYNLGSDITEFFAPMRDAPHIISTIVTRRRAKDGEIFEQFPVIIIDMDSTADPVVIPPNVWFYAFETKGFQFKIRPDVIMQVALVSHHQGWIVVGAISLLLLFCQDQFPLDSYSPEQVQKLTAKWERFYAIQDRWQVFPRKGFEPAPACFPGASLLLHRDQVRSILGDLSQGVPAEIPKFLEPFVKEIWVLTTPAGTGADGASDGEPFQWELRYARNERVRQEMAAWAISPRLRRNRVVGEPFTFNFVRLAPASERKYGWGDFQGEFAKPERVYLPYLAEVFPPKSFPPHPDSFREGPAATNLEEFRAFYKAEMKKDLFLVEAHYPFTLFQETDSPRLVSVCHPPFDYFASYSSGLLGIRALSGKVPARFFVHDPGSQVVEHDGPFMQHFACEQLAGFGAWQRAGEQVARLQGEHLSVDFLLPGLYQFADHLDRLHEGSIAGVWSFNREASHFEHALGGDDKVLSQLIEVAKLVNTRETMHPAAYHKELEETCAKFPEATRLFNRLLGESEQEEEEEDVPDEDEPLPEEKEEEEDLTDEEKDARWNKMADEWW